MREHEKLERSDALLTSTPERSNSMKEEEIMRDSNTDRDREADPRAGEGSRLEHLNVLVQLRDETAMLYEQERVDVDLWRVNALDDAIAALRADLWRPIETAPKDGNVIGDIWCRKNGQEWRVCGAFWATHHETWATHGGAMVNPIYVTHWRPLPAPPTQDDK